MIAKEKKQAWGAGDVFLIPLVDGEFCPGQVVAVERELLNSAAIALFDCKGVWNSGAIVPEPSFEQVFSVIFVTKDLLDSGRWRVISSRAVDLPAGTVPFEHLRESGFVGGSVRGSALVESFVNAFYGLEAWDDWYLPDYLDSYLLSADKKPLSRIVYSGRYPVRGG